MSSEMKRLMSLFESDTPMMAQSTGPQYVLVSGEGGEQVYEMSAQQIERCRQLFAEAEETGEYPEEVNDILAESREVDLVAVISTHGDGWGINTQD